MDIFEKFSSNLRQILVMSERIAGEQNARVDSEHQLLALILHKGTIANDVLTMFEITIDRAQLVASLVGPATNSHNGIKQDAKEAIQLAVQFALRFKHNQIDCEHLLMALISNKKFNSYNILERMGVNPGDIRAQIESIFGEIDKSNKTTLGVNDINYEAEDKSFYEPIEDGEPDANFEHFPAAPQFKTKVKGKNGLSEFTINISEIAAKGGIDPVIGREIEIERLIQTLIRRKKNNPVLIGEPGVGKTAIVEGLAIRIARGEVPTVIANTEIIGLDLPSLLAGTMYRGQFEARIKKLLDALEKNKKTILFIDELHTIIGAGSAEGSLDAANILKPKLARGDIRVIGATTLDEYKKHIERDAAFERRFQPIIIDEPSIKDTISILRGVSSGYEKHHNVKYSDASLEAAARLSKRYIQDRFLPDKAIDLIDEAAAAIKVKQHESSTLSKLYHELKKTVAQKDESVAGEFYEKATFLRQKEITITNKIKQLESKNDIRLQKEITAEDIALVVSKWTGVPIVNLKTPEKKRYLKLEEYLQAHIVGQDDAIANIAASIRRSRIGISNPNRPIGSFIFLGPTGVGKTELVKVMARELFSSDKSLIKIDMSEFMEKHNVSRLLGAPAGYIGYEEGGQLTERVRRQPYSIILFDEIEKAHPEVFNILLQIMEDGEISDSKGRKIDFRNTLIIMTSNLGTDIFNKSSRIGFSSATDKNDIIDQEYRKMTEQVEETIEHFFRPEFLNRIDQIIVFKPLSKPSIRKIVDLEIAKLASRISENDISIEISDEAAEFIADSGYKPEFGARPMRRIITKLIENPLSEAILRNKFKAGDTVSISLVKNKVALSKKTKP